MVFCYYDYGTHLIYDYGTNLKDYVLKCSYVLCKAKYRISDEIDLSFERQFQGLGVQRSQTANLHFSNLMAILESFSRNLMIRGRKKRVLLSEN